MKLLYIKKKTGAAIVFVIIASFIFTLIVSSLIFMLNGERTNVNKIESDLQARYTAEAGVEHTLILAPNELNKMINKSSLQLLTDVPVCPGYTYSTAIEKITENEYKISSSCYRNAKEVYRLGATVVAGEITVWEKESIE